MEAKERRNESAAAKLAADIEGEVNGNANESITLTLTHDTPPPSDFNGVKEDSSDIEKCGN